MLRSRMLDKIDVDVHLSEVLSRLRENGAFAQALKEIAEAKAGGKEIGYVNLITADGPRELSDDELDAVAGGGTWTGYSGTSAAAAEGKPIRRVAYPNITPDPAPKPIK